MPQPARYSPGYLPVLYSISFVQRQSKSALLNRLCAHRDADPTLLSGIMISGVDDEQTRQRVASFGFSGMLGSLWPVVPESSLITLAQQ
jgi:hypothetical protein